MYLFDLILPLPDRAVIATLMRRIRDLGQMPTLYLNVVARRGPDGRAAKSRASVRCRRKVHSTRWIAALPCRQDNDRCVATAHTFADCLRRASALLDRHTFQTVFSRISPKPFLASRTPSLRTATFFIPQCNNDSAISRKFASKGLQHEVDCVIAMPVAYG